MNKVIIILALALLAQFNYAQVTTTKVAEKNEEISTEPYDSLDNFLGKDVHKYIGQDLYLKGQEVSLRKYGYSNFVIDYNFQGYNRKENICKCCDTYSSRYDDLAGRYFSVIAVHKHPRSEESNQLYGNTYYLELKEKETGDEVFFEYDSQFEHTFPFIVTGFFIKQKQLSMNIEFVVRGKNWFTSDGPMTDMITGNPVSFEPGTKWRCVDLTIEEKYFTLSLILQNEKGERIPLSYDNVNNTHFVYLA